MKGIRKSSVYGKATNSAKLQQAVTSLPRANTLMKGRGQTRSSRYANDKPDTYGLPSSDCMKEPTYIYLHIYLLGKLHRNEWKQKRERQNFERDDRLQNLIGKQRELSIQLERRQNWGKTKAGNNYNNLKKHKKSKKKSGTVVRREVSCHR